MKLPIAWNIFRKMVMEMQFLPRAQSNIGPVLRRQISAQAAGSDENIPFCWNRADQFRSIVPPPRLYLCDGKFQQVFDENRQINYNSFDSTEEQDIGEDNGPYRDGRDYLEPRNLNFLLLKLER